MTEQHATQSRPSRDVYPVHLEYTTFQQAQALADQIYATRRTFWRADNTSLTLDVSENTLEGVQKMLEGSTSTHLGQISAGIGQLVRTLPKELREVEQDQALRADIEQLLADLQRAYPDPAPFTTEATVIDRVRTALRRKDQHNDR